MRNDVCTLISIYTSGAKQERKETEVYCEKKSAGRTEYSAAYAVGLRTRFVLSVDPMDFAGGELPSMVVYGGKEYNIYRDYNTDESAIELTVG